VRKPGDSDGKLQTTDIPEKRKESQGLKRGGKGRKEGGREGGREGSTYRFQAGHRKGGGAAGFFQ
jgi:hypothetical protein